MTEEFVLSIEGSGIIKHIAFNMIITWETKEDEEGDKTISSIFEKYNSKKNNRPIIILKDGIVNWMQENLENTVYSRCTSLGRVDGGGGGPELLFGSEGDRSLFVLKWL